ncbi:Phosphatidylinositol 4-phosphate 3-kinase C2 domain-containing subunit beta, partial [Goodea atripinnis]
CSLSVSVLFLLQLQRCPSKAVLSEPGPPRRQHQCHLQGDDLRQDMLTLQMIRIMNKIWIQEGLDMRMVIFKCFSTGRGRGSFKDRTLADWLQKHNPTDEQYDKAVENFIYSCAGCCVATYILGICDRHNDNIMLKTSGHMFHIDFGKFLGHAQMFGNIKRPHRLNIMLMIICRDRAPFVFTSDMAYVINGGDKPSSRFHEFVDLCCEAYNLIRKHTHLFLNLLGLVSTHTPAQVRTPQFSLGRKVHILSGGTRSQFLLPKSHQVQRQESRVESRS